MTSGKDGDGGPAAWKPFGVKITFGGYAAAEGVFRDKDQVTSIGSAFQKIPFDNLQQAHVNELRATAQQSRLSCWQRGTSAIIRNTPATWSSTFSVLLGLRIQSSPTATRRGCANFTGLLTTTPMDGTSWPANRGAWSRCSSRA